MGVICYRATDNWTFTLSLFENGYLATGEDKSCPKVLQNFHGNSVNTLVTLPINTTFTNTLWETGFHRSHPLSELSVGFPQIIKQLQGQHEEGRSAEGFP